MILNSPYVSGSLTVTGNITALGGISISGSIASASYAANAELLDGLDSSVFVLSSSFQNYSSSNDGKVAALNTFSASILSYTSSTDAKIAQLNRETASLNLATASLNNATASLYAATASIYNFTSSANLRIGSLEQYTQSLNTRSASFACVTATNNFGCAQYFSNASNAISFSSTGSLYSDGGMRITKDMYVSGTAYFNNVTVFGTQSINYITSSQLNIANNLITVNTSTPAVRFGGLAVYDSGSLGTGLTGSILWDSEANHWVYSNPSGSSYSGGMFISGPRSAALGSEQGTTACALMMGQGGDHITSSAIFHYGNATCFYGTSVISGSGLITTNGVSILNGNQFRVYNTGNGDYGNLTFATATGFTSDKQIQANGKLFIQRASNGADTLVQFKNEVGADRAYIKFGGTNEELAFYAGSGTTQNLMITATGTSCFYGAIQSCDRIGTCDNQGFYLRGIGDSTHRLYYNNIDGANVWEYNTTIKFNYYNTGSPTTRMLFDASGNMCVSGVLSAGGCLGVRTTSPQDLLEVYGDTNNGINICASNQPRLGFFVGGTSVDNKIWDFIPQANNTFIARVINDAKNSAATWLSVTRNGTSITSICFPQNNPILIGGCVGIGIVPNGPGLRLASCTVLRVEGACPGDATPDNFGISIGGLGSFRVDCGGVGAGRFIINSCGCVGINQPSPIFKLQVSSGGAKTSGTQDPSLFIGTNEVSNPWGLRVKPVGAASIGNRYVEFQTTEVNVADGGDVVFQNGGGRVGIGCASPGYVLDVRDGTTGSAGGRGMRLSVCSNSAGPQFRLEYQCSGDSRNWLIGTNQEASGDFIIRSSTMAGCDAGGACSATRFSINKDGCVGIGTVSPNGLLHIQQCRGGEVGFRITNSQGASADTSATVAINMTLQNGAGGSSGVVQLIAGKESDHQTAANVDDYFAITTTSNDATTERFRISADGRSYFTCQLRVGTAGVATNFFIDASTAGCVVSGTPGTTNGNSISGMRLYNLCSATSNSLVGLWFSTGPHWAGLASGRCDHNSGWGTDIRFYTHEDNTANLDQSTERVRINAGGTVTFFGYGAGTLSTNSSGVISASDGRLKTKTRAVENGLCTIMQLEPTYYRWNEDTVFHTEYEELGFIAQEVSCIIPEASPEPEQEGKLKNYNDRAIIAMLTKGMQEQQCIINTLKTCLGIA